MIQGQLKNITLELRRGVIALAVLSQLRQEHYGYSLTKQLNGQGLDIDRGTLYPLLRRLQQGGLLTSEWRVEGSRPRRYYQTSTSGEQALSSLRLEWRRLVDVMEALVT